MPHASSAQQRLYIHETIEITVRKRQDFLKHFVSWAPTSRKLYNMRLCGVWAVNGSTHRWPEAVVLWELDGLAAFARMLSGEYRHLEDPSAKIPDHYTLYWGGAAEGVTDTKGVDSLLAPTSYTPPMTDAFARYAKSAGYLHQRFKAAPGRIPAFLETLGNEWLPIANRLGLGLVGAFRVMLANESEAIAVWAFPSWDTWARYEAALESDTAAMAWRARAADAGVDWEGKLLNAAGGSPFDIGRFI